MLVLVVMLGLVLLAMKHAGNPRTWYWLTGTPETSSPTEISPAPRSMGTANSSQPVSPPTGELVIPADLLAEVRDDSVGLRANEIDSYHFVLARARDLSQKSLEAAAGSVATFTTLQRRPGYYRGQLLTVNGDLRRLTRFPVRDNEQGITVLYEALVFTQDSGTTPYRIRFTAPPQDLPEAEVLDPPIPVHAVGYFFKRDQYIVQNDLRVHAAPLLLAQRIDRRVATAGATVQLEMSAAEQLRWTIGLLGFVAVVLVVCGVLGYRARRGDHRFAQDQLKRVTAAPREALDALEEIDVHDPQAELYRWMAGDEGDKKEAGDDDG